MNLSNAYVQGVCGLRKGDVWFHKAVFISQFTAVGVTGDDKNFISEKFLHFM